MISYIIIGFTVLCLLGGFIFGLIRGFNRSVVRFCLVLLSLGGAWFLRESLANSILQLKINGSSIE